MIHPAYPRSSDQPQPYAGSREDLTPGTYLGGTAQPNIMRPGDIITSTTPVYSGSSGDYYYDPQLLIQGNSSYVRSNGNNWYTIQREDLHAIPHTVVVGRGCVDKTTNG